MVKDTVGYFDLELGFLELKQEPKWNGSVKLLKSK